MDAYTAALQALDEGCVPVFVVGDGGLYFRSYYCATPFAHAMLTQPDEEHRACVLTGMIVHTCHEVYAA